MAHVHTAPALARAGAGGADPFGVGFRANGVVGLTQGQGRNGHGHASSQGFAPFNASSLRGTPEDRQRAVAKLLSRDESFSYGVDEREAYELTPDYSERADGSPHSRPSAAIAAASAPPELSFCKQEVAPVRAHTSALALAGIHRASLGDRPVIETPNRYAVDAPAPTEYSDSGRKKANRFKCSVFLPVATANGAVPCLQLELKVGATAAQAVTQTLTNYLRTHTQPSPAMLGQPSSYRLHMAEEDGELDDAFPPLDPSCVVSSTGADCFLLQRCAAVAAASSAAHVAAAGSMPAAASASGVGQLVGNHRTRMGGLDGRDYENSESSSAFGDDADPTARRYLARGARHAHTSSSPDVDDALGRPGQGRHAGGGGGGGGGGPAARKSHRTSSDADDSLALDAEMQLQEEETGRRPARERGSSESQSCAPGAVPAHRAINTGVAPKRAKSFRTFSLRACLSCACLAPETEEATQPIGTQPQQRHSRHNDQV